MAQASPAAAPLLVAGGLRHAWHAGPAWGAPLVRSQVEARSWDAVCKEQLQAGAGAGSWLQQCAVFQELALLSSEQEVLQSFSPLTW